MAKSPLTTSTDKPTSASMERLVADLAALGARPAIRDLQSLLDSAGLSPTDVHAWVKSEPTHYNRSRVAISDAFELLVMTWLPGQASVPHDHAGSACALRVISGAATERTYVQADDGFVEEWASIDISAGQSVAGDDGGIHSVHNDDLQGRTLVTVHVYSPPLKDFRRYISRPRSSASISKAPSMNPQNGPAISVRDRRASVCIIGGGFSGSMTTANLLAQSAAAGIALDVTLIERRGTVGEGVAYGTSDPSHLLNVPASRMGAWVQTPEHFFAWAKQRRPDVMPSDFLPRSLYGQYLRQVLQESAQSAAPSSRLNILYDEARRIAHHPGGGWMVHLGRAPSVHADAAVLALGHRPPTDPLADRWIGPRHRFIADPWRPFAVQDIRPDEPVLIIGSGLTAIDVMLSLCPRPDGREAQITLLSRRALFPQSHSPSPLPAASLQEQVDLLLNNSPAPSALQLLRFVRSLSERLPGLPGSPDWRAVVDGLRGHTPRLWRSMPFREQRRFLEHARSFWEVHRHRMAPNVHGRVRQLQSAGAFRLLAGRVAQAHADQDGIELLLRLRGDRGSSSLSAAWVINCTGPSPSNHADASPIVASLLDRGAVSVDAHGLGLRTAGPGWSLDAGGQELHDLLVVGTLRKPERWESTAVPELRQQAAEAAEAVITRLRSLASVANRPKRTSSSTQSVGGSIGSISDAGR